MPLILGANSLAGGYQVKNSLRFNSGSSDYLNRTPASNGNQRTWTYSCWFKYSELNNVANLTLFWIQSGTIEGGIRIIGSGGAGAHNKINFYFYDNAYIINNFETTQVFRDPSAWYHLVLAVDTTQATSTNRVKFYINGSEVTNWTTTGYPTQNADTDVNTTIPHYIGTQVNQRYFGGYMAETYMIDGQQLTPSSFGETDEDTGIWKPKAYTGTFGTNGFYLDFEDSANLGNDMSGNNNDFTVNNLTSIDQTTDTPTNNFATLNGILPYNTTMVLTEGNLKGKTPTDHQGKMQSFFSDFAMTKGKWYAEFKVDVQDTTMIGISNDININQQGSTASAYNFIYKPSGWGYFSTGVVYYTNSDTNSSFGNSYTTGDIIGVALDLDNLKLYFSKNGTWQNSGDPTSGATGTGSVQSAGATALPSYDGSNPYFFAFCDFGSTNSTTVSANFGNPPFTIASGNADANGYGNFEYAVPSGYYALCTKNLYQYGF